MRVFFRVLSFFSVLAAVLVAVFDCVQSFAAGVVVLTPLRVAWATVNERSAEVVENFLRGVLHSPQWNSAIDWIFGQPAVADLLVLSLLFWMVGYKRQHLAGRFAA